MTEKPWRVWFQENTDKFILLFTFMVLLGFVVYTMSAKMDEGAVDWARSSTDLVLGGLLGLITGKYLAEKRSVDQVIHQPPLPPAAPTLEPNSPPPIPAQSPV